VETQVSKQMKDDQCTYPEEFLVKVQVKLEGGLKVLHMVMARRESISDIFDLAHPYWEDGGTKQQLELRTIFPLLQFYYGDKRTLGELGFSKR